MEYWYFAKVMQVSAVGFGAWAISGDSFGAVDRQESLRALARARRTCQLFYRFRGGLRQF